MVPPLEQEVAADHLKVLQHVDGRGLHRVAGAEEHAGGGVARYSDDIGGLRIGLIAERDLLGVVEGGALHRAQISIDDGKGGVRHLIRHAEGAAVGRRSLVMRGGVVIAGLVEQVGRRGMRCVAEQVAYHRAEDGADQRADPRQQEAADRAEQLAADRAFVALCRHQQLPEERADHVSDHGRRVGDRAGHRRAPVDGGDCAIEGEAGLDTGFDLGEHAEGKTIAGCVEQLPAKTGNVQRIAEFGRKEGRHRAKAGRGDVEVLAGKDVGQRHLAEVGGHRGRHHQTERLPDQAADRAANHVAGESGELVLATQQAAKRRTEDLADGAAGVDDVLVQHDLGTGDLAVGGFGNVEFVVEMGVVGVVFLDLLAAPIEDHAL